MCPARATSERPKGGGKGPEEVQGQEGRVVRYCGRLRESKACRRQEQVDCDNGNADRRMAMAITEEASPSDGLPADSSCALFSRPRDA